MNKLKKYLLYFLVCLTTLLVLGLGFIRYKTYQAHQSSMATALSGVKSVTFSSKDDQLAKLKETYGDDWTMFDGDSNPLQDVYVVEATSASKVKKVANKISKIEGVESVNYGGSNSDQLFKISKFIRTWGAAGTVLLVVVAIFLISNTIRMTIMSRHRDIEIMRLVGAKNSYIRVLLPLHHVQYVLLQLR